MGLFSYSLILSLIHSIWQSALLICLYTLVDICIKRTNPLVKRNILFLFLGTQIFTTISTFFIYYTDTSFFNITHFVNNINELLILQPTFANIAPWITIVYFFVIVYKILRLILHWNRFKFNSRSAWIKPPVDMKLFCMIKSNEFGIKRKVSLWYSNTINTPLTFGFFKPIILLPVALVNNLSVSEAESLIIHELAHIKSNDYFLNWLLIISETVYFFNPFFLIIVNKIRMEREKNCDASVLQYTYTPISYAETLLKAARFNTNPEPFFLTAAFKNAQLIKRVRFFTEENNLQFYKRNFRIFAFLPVLLMFLSCLYIVNLHKSNLEKGFRNNIQQVLASKYYGKNDGRLSTRYSPVNKVEFPAAEIISDPIVNKKMNPGYPMKNNISDKYPGPEVINESTDNTELVIPVALAEADFKEVILKEENSATGRSITKAYKLQLVKGKWQRILLWSINETRQMNDSLQIVKDSTGFYDNAQ